jgi:hypothetical protein
MKKNDLFMSPLADPVVGEIFSGMEQAGLAAESLVGSILSEGGYTLGKVIDVVPQVIAASISSEQTRRQ